GCGKCGPHVDLLAGFRYAQLDEGLTVREDLNVLAAPAPIGGSTIELADEFGTHNRFYGGPIGARAAANTGRVFVNVVGKVALGGTEQTVGINGTTVITPAGGARSAQPGGLLALPTNSGRFERSEFTVVPEVGLNVGLQVTNHLRAYVGYNFLYWSSVARPGDQIDLGGNPT